MSRIATVLVLALLSQAPAAGAAGGDAETGDDDGTGQYGPAEDVQMQQILDEDLDGGHGKPSKEKKPKEKKPKKKLWSWLLGPSIDWDASFLEEVAPSPSVMLPSRRPEDPFDVAAAADLVTIASIKEIQASSVAQALADVQGMSVVQPMHSAASPVMRGLLGQRIALLFDGVRMDVAGIAPGPSILSGLVDPLGLDAIEAVRGPSPVLAGPFALGGALNFVPALPLVNPLVSYRTQAWILYRFGSADTSQVIHANLEFQIGDAAVVADFGYSVIGSLENGSSRIPFTGYDSLSFHFAARKLFGDTGDLLLFYGTARISEAYQGLGEIGDLAAFMKWPHVDRDLLYARLAGAPGGLDRLELTVGMHMLPVTGRLYDPGQEGVVGPTWEVQQLRSTSFFVTAWGSVPLGAWGSLIAGIDDYLDIVDAGGSIQTVTGSTLQVDGIERPALPDGALGNSLEPHVMLDIKATSAFHLSLGSRFWYHRLEPGAGDPTRDLVGGSGMISGSLAIGSMASLVIDLSYGTRPPTMFEVAGSVCAPVAQVPSPWLDPEGALGAQLGLKWNAGILEGSLFYGFTMLDHAVAPKATESVDRCGQPDAVEYVNSGKAWIHSIEFENRVNLLGFMTIGTVLGWYHGTMEKTGIADGGPMPWIPPLMGTAFIRFSYPRQYLWGDVRLRFAIAQDRLPAGYSPTESEDDPFFLLSVRGGVALGGSIRLFLAFENILNQVHRWYGSSLDGPGRSVLVGIEGHL